MADDQDRESFKPETINGIFKAKFKESSSRVNKDALLLSCEFLRLFTAEAIHRSAEQVTDTDDVVINAEHLERTLTQLLLDF
ncbi:centromere protein X-like protein [Phascolomyces articulosus]|uniref:Centromere protein X-like protein n=1 Tax=Phascolomyces articulosus TaxID=60185 RepID=A0AAD5K8K3_9FUNG|nr:centromere protein X-like protein [Phascolomyces articulosus]